VSEAGLLASKSDYLNKSMLHTHAEQFNYPISFYQTKDFINLLRIFKSNNGISSGELSHRSKCCRKKHFRQFKLWLNFRAAKNKDLGSLNMYIGLRQGDQISPNGRLFALGSCMKITE
jgi:hypothetical protein